MTANGKPTKVPTESTDYGSVPRMAVRIAAREVRTGDVLLLDGYVVPVGQVRQLDLPGFGPVLHLASGYNAVRFPHEIVSVIRP